MSSRTSRFRGQTPNWMTGDWTISTVEKRFQNKSATDVCAVTGEPVDLDDPHYYVTVKRKGGYLEPNEYEHFVVATGALEELENQVS